MAEQQDGLDRMAVMLADPEIRVAYLSKLQAETEKLMQEAYAARIEGKANADRLTAEADRLNAERLQLDIERHKLNFDTRSVELDLRNKEREQAEKETHDKFYRHYFFKTSVGESSVTECVRQIDQWRRMAEKDGKLPIDTPIEITFFSPGGSVHDGMVLFDYLLARRREGYHVTTGAYGYAASMAGILLQAGTTRWMGPGAWVLIHEITTGAVGKIGDMEDTVEWCKRIQQYIISIFAQRAYALVEAGKNVGPTFPLAISDPTKPLEPVNKDGSIHKVWESKEEVRHYIDVHWNRKDWWLSAQECLLHGFVDEIR